MWKNNCLKCIAKSIAKKDNDFTKIQSCLDTNQITYTIFSPDET